MAKQKKKPRCRNPVGMQSAERTQISVGFCLPDTPDNRDLVAMLTGTNAARFVDGRGNLDSEAPFGQKNSGDCEPSNLNHH